MRRYMYIYAKQVRWLEFAVEHVKVATVVERIAQPYAWYVLKDVCKDNGLPGVRVCIVADDQFPRN